jgi:hypothetical protein
MLKMLKMFYHFKTLTTRFNKALSASRQGGSAELKQGGSGQPQTNKIL